MKIGPNQKKALQYLKRLVAENPEQVWYRAWEFADDDLDLCDSLVKLGFLELDLSQGYRYKPTSLLGKYDPDEAQP